MKSYSIPIAWESYKTFDVEADSLQEATEIALKQFLAEPDENYLDDSFSIDDLVSDSYPDEEFDFHLAMQNIFE